MAVWCTENCRDLIFLQLHFQDHLVFPFDSVVKFRLSFSMVVLESILVFHISLETHQKSNAGAELIRAVSPRLII
jgi:hypothetical protein